MKYMNATLQKFRFFVFALLLSNTLVRGQTKNKIGVHIGTYHFYDVYMSHGRLLSQLGLSYERKLSERFSVAAAYTRSPFNFEGRAIQMKDGYNAMTTENNGWGVASEEGVHSRYNYNYFDVGVLFGIYRYTRHSLRIGASASLANGLNTYVMKPDPTAVFIDDWYIREGEMIRESYFGGVLGLQYQFEILSDKLSVSAMTHGRFYAGNFPFQMNYGLQAAFHF